MENAHFGIYHLEPSLHHEDFLGSLLDGVVDTYILNYWDEALCIRTLKSCMEAGRTCWVSISGYVFDVSTPAPMVDVGADEGGEFAPGAHLKADWRERIDRLFARIREAGVWEGFAGLYMDEPLLWGVSLEEFEAVTRYPREKHPDKGFFVCFSVAGVAPDIWTTGHVSPITARAGQYLTDVSFDMYHSFDETYEYIAGEMKRRLGNRGDLRVWYVPCIMDYRGDKEERHCLEHLRGCYELLRREACPGGLFCYTYHTFPPEEEAMGNIGLSDLKRPDHPKHWPTLAAEVRRIGREITGAASARPQ